MKDKKVYCIECRYVRPSGWDTCCEHKSNILIKDTPLQKEIIYELEPRIINSNNNCKNFKKERNYILLFCITVFLSVAFILAVVFYNGI
jgi:hypothetical protein